DAEPLDEVVEPGVLHGVGRLGPAHGQGDGIGLPVGQERGAGGQREGQGEAPAATSHQEVEGDDDERDEADEPGDQEDGAALVGGDLFVHGGWSGAQNWTWTGPRESSSASKYSRSVKP